MTQPSIAIVVPVLKRPERARPLIENVHANTTVPHRLLFIPTYTDRAEIAALEAAGADYIVRNKPSGPGDYAAKINQGYHASSEPFVFTGADDLVFHPGWDLAALEPMKNSRIGVVGTNDLGNPQVMAGEHSTHSLVRRTYADKYGLIDKAGMVLNPLYWHEFVDNELVETAKHRGAFAMALDSIVEHLHPHWNKRPEDELTRQASRRLAHGRRVYNRRKGLWAPAGSKGTAPFSVVVGTFGDKSWKDRAKTAMESVYRQSMQATDVIHVHGNNLASARNEGAAKASAPWLIFLDADDELAPGYLEAMAKASVTSAGVLNPSVQFITPEDPDPIPRMFNPRPLERGNYLVIGTAVRKKRFEEIGGFDPQWEAYEDWQMFRRVLHPVHRVLRVPKAIYRAFWRADGRNNTVPDKEGLVARMRAEFDRWAAQQTKVTT